MNLSKCCAIDLVKTNVAAGAADITDAAEVDMAGYDGVVFIALLGTLTAGQVTKLRANGGSVSGTHAELVGATTPAAADGDSNRVLVVDVHKPLHRYMRPSVLRATQNAVINGIIAIRYHGSKAPVTQAATVAEALIVASPAAV